MTAVSASSKSKSWWSSFFSLSNLASILTVFYIGNAIYNFHRIMYPLKSLDLSAYKNPQDFVHPWWAPSELFYLRVYLSTQQKLQLPDLLKAGYESDDDGEKEEKDDSRDDSNVILLWDDTIDSSAVSKSFLLTTLDDTNNSPTDNSFNYANKWLDEAENRALERGEGGILAAVVSSAGQGIESTSILLTLYQYMARQVQSFISVLSSVVTGKDKIPNDDAVLGSTTAAAPLRERSTVHLKQSSPIWSALTTNATLFVHVYLFRAQALPRTSYSDAQTWPPKTAQEFHSVIGSCASKHGLLRDSVQLIKWDVPHHISKPKRVLLHDLVYIWRSLTRTLGDDERPPWDMQYSKPQEFSTYQRALEMKKSKTGYPYWKPEVAVKYVNDNEAYPVDYVHMSGMPLVQLQVRPMAHPSGYTYLPGIHVDEIGLTSEKYIPINETLSSLPLRISFHRNDVEDDQHRKATTASAGGMSPARWRLLTQLSEAIEGQKQLGFDQSDIDDLRRLVADTNVTLLAITVLASCLHLLFEFLTFKNEVNFWSQNKDLTGLSVRSLFLDVMGQTVILFYLIDRESSLLITIPSAIGVLIGLWKCQRGAGFKFVKADPTSSHPVSWWNWLPRHVIGYELKATRLEIPTATDKEGESSPMDRLTVLTIESDRLATRTLGAVLLPFVVGYILYSFVREEHSSWFSWIITCASSAVYALGFVLMTPQLFLNYKLKSVAHLPWRVLVYKSLNTFIDDLFSFIIRMPTMARISCFRDDVVFFIYIYQRWLYPVDKSRPIEGGDGQGQSENISETKKNQ